MTRICPSCGSKAIDDQSLFCNKCGAPFPEDQPKKVLVRTTPRLAETPPQPVPPAPEPPVSPPPPAYQPPAASPARSYAEPPAARPPLPRQVPQQVVKVAPLPFSRCLIRDSLRPLYWLGVIAILLIVLGGMMAGSGVATTTEGADNKEQNPLDILSVIPAFWIGVFIAANLIWRVLCESAAVLITLHDASSPPDCPGNPGLESFPEAFADDLRETLAGETARCPRCGRTVAVADLRNCEHCGVAGCSNCIRLMGLLKKTLTCKDCFESK